MLKRVEFNICLIRGPSPCGCILYGLGIDRYCDMFSNKNQAKSTPLLFPMILFSNFSNTFIYILRAESVLQFCQSKYKLSTFSLYRSKQITLQKFLFSYKVLKYSKELKFDVVNFENQISSWSRRFFQVSDVIVPNSNFNHVTSLSY